MISIECYKGLPIDYESFLIEKYRSYITTCRYVEVYYPTYDNNYMLVYEDANLIEIMLFGNRGNICTCYNSLVNIDQDIINVFSKELFKNFPGIKKIQLAASYTSYDLNKSFLHSKSNDYILSLPSTIEEYYSGLGSTTRKHIKNYKSRLLRDHPEVLFSIKLGTEIEESIIDKIVQLSYNRMKYKGIIPGKDHKDTNDFYRYSQHYGCVAYIEINGLIVAGCISYILNQRIFLFMIAHDNNFSRYNLGQLCIIHLIQASIGKKLSTFHFLWGENDYKMKLSAKPHSLLSYTIYQAYSVDFIINYTRAIVSRMLILIRLSKYSKPVRDTIKFFRRRLLTNK